MALTALIIDDDQQRAENIQARLSKLGDWQSVVSPYKNSDKQLDDVRVIRTIFVGAGNNIDSFEHMLKIIKQRDCNLPLVAVFDKKPDSHVVAQIHDYCCSILTTPITDDLLQQTLTEINTWRRRRRQTQPRRPLELFRSMSGSSEAVTNIQKLIYQVAPTDATVLVTGSSGTGKEVVARKIHYFSARRNEPFVPVNCGAIPESLLESELFGYEKGAFTGAITSRQGRFELAQGGTLFLDEIGDMPLLMQVKLLRVLQERVFERIGSNKPITADVRIVCATHRNLEEMITNNTFREDLYYRINVFPIDIPKLSDRIEDLPELVHDLLARIKYEQDVEFSLSPEALNILSEYSWPGNIRELANLMDRLAILYPDHEVQIHEIPSKFRGAALKKASLNACAQAAANQGIPSRGNGSISIVENVATPLPDSGVNLKQYLSDIESHLIQAALEKSDGVVAQAAELLHIRRTTLVEKMRKYQITRSGNEVNA